MVTSSEKLKALLEEKAARKCWSDDEDFSPDDYSGGNYDDAYYGGCSDGEAILAREILEVFYPKQKTL